MKKSPDELKAFIIENLGNASLGKLKKMATLVCLHSELRPQYAKADEDGRHGSAMCLECEEVKGEWCSASPTHVCEFDTDDCCKHCGELDPWEDK